jgi:predicted transcriptional regulator
MKLNVSSTTTSVVWLIGRRGETFRLIERGDDPSGLPRADFSIIVERMEVHFTPEVEEKLKHSAREQGRNPDELVQEVVARHLDEENRFVQAVIQGEDALRRGEYLTHHQVGERLERFLNP